ncbi:protein saal1 isoform X2 [Apis cerana]|uniref:protein saal1 isoform X2 n=1 Tax=Apis cerana TaxID=7461 RepID=UPI002B22C767|nr:protein saal1 isoform X2 [Apis cerana]
MNNVLKSENAEVKPNIILESQDIEKNEIKKLKGDIIGDTLYSGKWIINILFSISKISEDGWNEKIENDLCILWDMTTEKDIVHFLMENHFFKIAEFALKSSEEPRFTEIILGIIGNMTCESSVLDLLGEKEELLDIILHLLSSEDTAILMQILRLLRSALWNIQMNLKSKWRINLRKSTFLREVVPFILKSSTNGMLESFEEVFPQDETSYSVSTLKYLEDWLELFSILRKGHQIHQEILQEDNLIRIVEILRRILISFTDPWNLYPLDEIKASCVHRCAEVILDFRWKGFLRADSTIDIDATILNIVVSIHTAMKEEEEDSKETMAELLKYLEGYWIEVSKISSTNEIIKILKTNEKAVIDHTINLLKSKISEEKINDVINKLSYE